MIKPLTLISLLLTVSLSAFAVEPTEAELLAQCDGMTRAGTIDPALKDGVIGGFPEKKCEKEAELAKGKEELAKGKEELAKVKEKVDKQDDDYSKMIQILALLRPAEARTYLADEIQRVQESISAEKARNSAVVVELLERRLNMLRTEQQKMK